MTSPSRIRDAYGPANVLFRALGPLGWGELINLGYYTPAGLPMLPAGLAPFQRRLVSRSTGLLRLSPADEVLDAACGRGYSSDLMGRAGARVTGVDLLDEHVAESVRRFGTNPNVRFLSADITALRTTDGPGPFGDGSFSRVHCLEAAFHLGPEGRRAFLEEAYRVLRPGGRLVLADLVWRTDSPSDIRHADPGRLVRDTWRFEELEPLGRYLRHAVDIGYLVRAAHDWSRPVTDRFMLLANAFSRLALSRPGRRLLCRRWPGLEEITHADWLRLAAVTQAHNALQRTSGYAALVLDKPGGRDAQPGS
ncbi:class I SAM-dependent methyltransferase [Streptomyces sp. NPDC001407]|uniref:class I SAM-dependent methyltransferase n=1 Tax=Streptomyces sp. NPDC001407 TaxID=3364573 RepID=UPI0036C5BAED